MSASAWKLLMVVLALTLGALLVAEIGQAPRIFAPEGRGTLGITFHERAHWGPSRYIIDTIAPDSPLLAEAGQAGDLWYPDRAYDAYRRLEANEEIGLTLIRDGKPRHLTLRTISDPEPVRVAAQLLHWLMGAFAFVLGLLIALRQPDGIAFRGLALFMICLILSRATPAYLLLPAGGLFQLQHLLWGPVYGASIVGFWVFAFNYPDAQSRGTAIKRWLLRFVMPILSLLIIAMMSLSLVRAAGYHAPYFQSTVALASTSGSLFSLLLLWSNWRSSEGELRQRNFWIFLALSLVAFAPASGGMMRVLGFSNDALILTRVSVDISLLLFTYATLRHRVVNTGFAINRAVVYGVASMGMLVAFGLLEWIVHSLFHTQSPYIDAGIALTIFLTFHSIRHRGEQWIEKLFFHAWHVKERRMRDFVVEAAYIAQPGALLEAFSRALDRFTDAAGHALYRRTDAGGYQRVAATLAAAPERIDIDDALAVFLRARQSAVHCSDTETTLPGAIALPSIHHGELDGFVLLGDKPCGETYRPDEIEVLAFATHQVGLDFRALRMEQLEREVATLRVEKDALAEILQPRS